MKKELSFLSCTAQIAVKELVARRWALVALAMVPLAFYAARRSDAGWQGIRMACMGLSWAISTVSLFSMQAALPIEPRLRLNGARVATLYCGRLLGLLAVASCAAILYCGVVLLDQDVESAWAVVAALTASVWLSVPLGMLVGRLVPREFEGMLVLITIVGLQTIIDPERGSAKALPLWGIRSFLDYAIEGRGDMSDGAIHSGAYMALLITCGYLASSATLRSRKHIVYVNG